jgi:hypothetical protein
MRSLRDHLVPVPVIRPRSLGAAIAPAMASRSNPATSRIVEEAAITVLAHIYAEAGPIREALTAERRRFEVLAAIVHRLPPAGGGR